MASVFPVKDLREFANRQVAFSHEQDNGLDRSEIVETGRRLPKALGCRSPSVITKLLMPSGKHLFRLQKRRTIYLYAVRAITEPSASRDYQPFRLYGTGSDQNLKKALGIRSSGSISSKAGISSHFPLAIN